MNFDRFRIDTQELGRLEQRVLRRLPGLETPAELLHRRGVLIAVEQAAGLGLEPVRFGELRLDFIQNLPGHLFGVGGLDENRVRPQRELLDRADTPQVRLFAVDQDMHDQAVAVLLQVGEDLPNRFEPERLGGQRLMIDGNRHTNAHRHDGAKSLKTSDKIPPSLP